MQKWKLPLSQLVRKQQWHRWSLFPLKGAGELKWDEGMYHCNYSSQKKDLEFLTVKDISIVTLH